MVSPNASTEIHNIYLNRHQKALEWKKLGKKVFGYFEVYVPEEVIYAGGILPVRILGSNEYPANADLYIDNFNCPHHRSCLDLALGGEYDYLDGYVASDSCDSTTKFYSLWKKLIKKPYTYFITLPHKESDRAYAFFLKGVIAFKQWLEEALQKDISNAGLKHAINIYNKNRALLKKVYDLRRGDPPLISGVEALKTVVSSMVTPKEQHNKLLSQLLEEIPNRANFPKKGPRLLITGNLIYDTELLRLIEGFGANVVADDISTGSRFFWDEVNLTIARAPLSAIAKHYIKKIPSPYMFHFKERYNHLAKMIKRYNVQGVIVNNLRFCSPHLGDYPHLKSKLEELDIPHTRIEHVQISSGIKHLRSRIEPFIELLA